MRKKHWLYIVVVVYSFIQELVKASFSLSHLIGAMGGAIVTGGLFILIVELFLKIKKKK